MSRWECDGEDESEIKELVKRESEMLVERQGESVFDTDFCCKRGKGKRTSVTLLTLCII